METWLQNIFGYVQVAILGFFEEKNSNLEQRIVPIFSYFH